MLSAPPAGVRREIPSLSYHWHATPGHRLIVRPARVPHLASPSDEWLHGPIRGGQRVTANSLRYPEVQSRAPPMAPQEDRCTRDATPPLDRFEAHERFGR